MLIWCPLKKCIINVTNSCVDMFFQVSLINRKFKRTTFVCFYLISLMCYCWYMVSYAVKLIKSKFSVRFLTIRQYKSFFFLHMKYVVAFIGRGLLTRGQSYRVLQVRHQHCGKHNLTLLWSFALQCKLHTLIPKTWILKQLCLFLKTCF